MNFYTVLGVPANADDPTIRRAYRVLARRYHPDSGAGSSPEKFRQVSEAYETLIEPTRRHLYDLSIRPRSPIPVVVEPLAAPPERGRYRGNSRAGSGLYELLDELMRSLEEEFGSGFGDY